MKNINIIYTIFFTLLFLLASYFIYKTINPTSLPANLVAGTGRIDGDLIFLNTKYPGRILEMNVNDGDMVKKGDVVAVLSSEELKARFDAISQGIEAALKNKDAAVESIKALEYNVSISEESLPRVVKSRQKAVQQAESAIKALHASREALELKLEQSKRDYERVKSLYEEKLVSDNDIEMARLQRDADEKQLESMDQQIIAHGKEIDNLRIAVKIEQTNLLNIDILKQQLKARNSELGALSAQIEQAKAQRREISVMLDELIIRSPIDGVVIDRIAQIGMVIGEGGNVLLLINPSELYLQIFVDTIENGKIKLGNKGQVFLDAYPDNPIEATVVRIEQRAEFTPKEVQIRSDRIQLMFAVHLMPDEYHPNLKLGLPAIGVISLDGKGLLKSSRSLGNL